MASTAAPPRTLLVISGARDATPVIAEASRMGLLTLVADGAPDAPGFRLADAGLLTPSRDAEATVEAARAYASRTPIAGVIGVGSAVAGTVAAVAHALGLPGVPPTVAALLADRHALRARLAAQRIAVPWSTPVDSPAALERAAASRETSLVVRPLDEPGPAVLLAPGVEMAWAFELAAARSPSGRVMVEERVDGPRVHVECVVAAARTTVVSLADVVEAPPDRGLPFLLDAGTTAPSRLHPALREQVESLVTAAVAKLGIGAGVVAAEAAIGPRGPVIAALGVHLSGGYVCTHEVPLATGVDLVEAAVRLALGETPDPAVLRPRWARGVARRLLVPFPGTVLAVQGGAEAAAGEGIALLEVGVAPGQLVPRAGDAGVVIAVADTREVAVARVQAAVARVAIVTAPVLTQAPATLH